MKNLLYICCSVFLFLCSCDTWDEDINIDKNVPNLKDENLSPSFFMGGMFNGAISINGDWDRSDNTFINAILPVTAYYGKTRSLSQGNRHRSWHDFDGHVWPHCYASIRNIKNVRNIALNQGDNRYVAVADIWESWMFYMLTTFYGDIPYSLVIADDVPLTGIDYDKQRDIYAGLLTKLKAANDLLAGETENIDEASDWIYYGDIAKWRKFSNTLRLRMALHMYNADPEEAKSIANEILNDPARYPVLESNEDNFQINFDGASRTSLYYRYNPDRIKQIALSQVFVERLASLKDPRLYRFATPVKKVHEEPGYVVPQNPGEDKYLGHLYGITTSDGDAASWNGGWEYSSLLGPAFRPMDENLEALPAAAATPIKLATYSEMLFNLAEMAQRGIIGGDPSRYYDDAIRASFIEYDVLNGFAGRAEYDRAYADQGVNNAEEYLEQPQVNFNGTRDKLLLINEQRWIAIFQLHFEPYFHYRRTMLPGILASDNAGSFASTGSGKFFPSRASYPTSEAAENLKAYEKARAEGYDIAITGQDNRNLARMWLINNASSPSLEMETFEEPMLAEDEYPGSANFQDWYNNTWKKSFWWENE
ncbi:SusD/RagB family nutrient-binding outer membrane lipoprotein [Fulvivirga ulvae]|uniref:SusD/RagB family nutrient-binding outer membrane lipoprotein n=1 Tax=Fulvivirga ulvae TaxID=2904245 RepID=UPI001F428C83|nr:SusD/RagB family nutrient-binding outer membrane lipoprotein [Fulvivirga ulvae]UII29909.1 SusD/RagB family nutrient-binding outer membrane lipoprotein [Fulvivirga ulvae]